MQAAGSFSEPHDVGLIAASVEAARGRGIKSEVADLNQHAPPYPDGFFNAVICLVIARVFDPERAVAEL